MGRWKFEPYRKFEDEIRSLKFFVATSYFELGSVRNSKWLLR